MSTDAELIAQYLKDHPVQRVPVKRIPHQKPFKNVFSPAMRKSHIDDVIKETCVPSEPVSLTADDQVEVLRKAEQARTPPKPTLPQQNNKSKGGQSSNGGAAAPPESWVGRQVVKVTLLSGVELIGRMSKCNDKIIKLEEGPVIFRHAVSMIDKVRGEK
jgi:hypothetical protein